MVHEHSVMEGIDPLATAPVEPFQPGAGVSEQVDDDFTDEQAAVSSDYPPLAKQGECAKKLGLCITPELHRDQAPPHRQILRRCAIKT